MHWFTGDSHKLMNYGLSAKSNERLLDTLCGSMLQLKEGPANIANEQFAVNIFSTHELEILPFKEHKEHKEHMRAKKNQFKIIHDESKPCHLLRKELLTLNDPSNVETDYLIEELGSFLASTLLREFADV